MAINFAKNITLGPPPKPTSSRNAVVEVVLLLLVCALFFWFMILPKSKVINQKQTQLVGLQQQRDDMSKEKDALDKLVTDLGKHSVEVGYLDQALPLDGKTLRLQILIDALAKSVGVTVGDISVSGQKEGPVAGDKNLLANPYGVTRSLQTLHASVYVIGTFNQLNAFLQKVETAGRIMDVTGLSMDAAPLGNLNLKIELNSYYLAP